MVTWATAAPAVSAAFLASAVEIVEAFTIVLAVATIQGWRPAATGTAAALAFLAAIVLAFGPVLDRVPLDVLQLVIGVLLLLFGLRWLRKAVLRAAGIVALHDEEKAFAEQESHLRAAGNEELSHLHWIAGVT